MERHASSSPSSGAFALSRTYRGFLRTHFAARLQGVATVTEGWSSCQTPHLPGETHTSWASRWRPQPARVAIETPGPTSDGREGRKPRPLLARGFVVALGERLLHPA